MLETLAPTAIDETICRLANARRRLEALHALGLDENELAEVLNFIGAHNDGDADLLLDEPFRNDPTYRPEPTRFSDGSWRVFYAALSWETTAEELGPHVRKAVSSSPPRVFYQRLQCRLKGTGYDLRPKSADWTFLTQDHSAYPQCQSLAREAISIGAEAFVTPSARHSAGVNTPIFARSALTAAEIVGSAVIVAEGSSFRVEWGGSTT